MESGERKHACDQPAQDISRRLTAFWGNQLQRLKQRSERLAKGTNKGSTYDGKFGPGPGLQQWTLSQCHAALRLELVESDSQADRRP